MESKKRSIIEIVKNNLLNIVILISFIILAIIFSNYHEHWSDEVQSWLIARDNSVLEIIKYTKYEGTPCLWFLILKLFINLGFTIDSFYLIPIIFTSIGLYLLLFKTNIPWYIKILFPFSYFIFFQPTIVCRSYCLVLPAITLIYLFYEKRFEKPFRFFIALIFFMNISLHTYLVAGSIFLIYLYDFYKKSKSLSEIEKNKNITCTIITFFSFLLILILLFPKSDVGFGGNGGHSLLYIFGESTISSNNNLLAFIPIIIFIYMLIKYNSLEDGVKLITLFMPLVLLLMLLHCQMWHIAVLFETLFIVLIKYIDKKLVKIFITVMLLIQVLWNIQSISFDYNNLYSPAKEIADFIKQIDDYENKKIYGINYISIAIQAYFEKNVFDNFNTDKANYCWSTSNGYYTLQEIEENMPDVCVIAINVPNIYIGNQDAISKSARGDAKKLIEKLKQKNYIEYNFIGNLYLKNYISEQHNFLVYVKQGIN